MGRVPTDGSRSGLRTTVVFTDGSDEVASVESQLSPLSVVMAGWEAGASGRHDGSDRGDILAGQKAAECTEAGVAS